MPLRPKKLFLLHKKTTKQSFPSELCSCYTSYDSKGWNEAGAMHWKNGRGANDEKIS